MIKNRDNFLLFIPVLIAGIVLLTTFLLIFQLKQFGASYIKDAEEELNVDTKQALWIIKPILENNDYAKLNKYCSDMKNEKMRLTIINPAGKVIADSKTGINKLDNHSNRPEIKAAQTGQSNTTIRYSNTMHSEMVYHSEPVMINGEGYIVRVSVSADNIEKVLNRAEKNIILTFLIGTGGVIILSLYIFLRVRIPFNKLQQSTIKIASGNLDTEVYVPKNGILWELARAVDIMSKQLKRQIKNMKKMENFRSEFIANVSHEVKTPLTSILSAVEILDGIDNTNPRAKKCLKIISEQSKRLNRLIQDILSLADLEKKQIFKNRDFAELSINSTVENAVNLCRGLTDAAGIEVVIEENTPTKIFGNSYFLEQAINNLITNAVKYSKTDKIVINAHVENNEIKISVKDFGIGMKKEEAARIFERFYRVDKARSRELGGTGLGLAIVKNIAKLHNGNVEVITSPGRGANFIITIPII